jgi:hypothetical protein
VLTSPPVSNIPKQILKAPPLDTANPTLAHSYLPVPSSSAKLKGVGQTSSSGTPVAPPNASAMPSAAAHTTPGPQIFGRFPPETRQLSEEELDPYFVNFENTTKDIEALLNGPMEKTNRRLLMHLGNWGEDMADLGARFNAFSLSEQSQTLAAAVEKTGQAVDSTYIGTTELASSLSASFSEPMRESAQFAGVVRTVLKYRVMKRIQEDMTKDELEKKLSAYNHISTVLATHHPHEVAPHQTVHSATTPPAHRPAKKTAHPSTPTSRLPTATRPRPRKAHRMTAIRRQAVHTKRLLVGTLSLTSSLALLHMHSGAWPTSIRKRRAETRSERRGTTWCSWSRR